MRKLGSLAAVRAYVEAQYAARRAAYLHEVQFPGMLRLVMGDDAFFETKAEHCRWISEMGYGPYIFDTLDDANGVEIGRSYRFADPDHAFHFRMHF